VFGSRAALPPTYYSFNGIGLLWFFILIYIFFMMTYVKGPPDFPNGVRVPSLHICDVCFHQNMDLGHTTIVIFAETNRN